MKKINYLLVLIFPLFISCTSSRPKEKKDSEQDKFIELVSQRIDSINSCISANPIQTEKNKAKKSYYTRRFFNIISNYADSIQIVKNWKGIVKDFKYEKGVNCSFIRLSIEMQYEGSNLRIHYPNNRIVLKSIYTIDNKLKDKDAVFNSMSQINTNSSVYIMGFFNRSMNGYVAVGDNIRELNFSVLNISTTPISSYPISDNMKEAIDRKFKEMKILGRGMLNDKSEKKIEKEMAYLKIDSVRGTLNNDEITLIDKIEELYVLNLAREYVDKK